MSQQLRNRQAQQVRRLHARGRSVEEIAAHCRIEPAAIKDLLRKRGGSVQYITNPSTGEKFQIGECLLCGHEVPLPCVVCQARKAKRRREFIRLVNAGQFDAADRLLRRPLD